MISMIIVVLAAICGISFTVLVFTNSKSVAQKMMVVFPISATITILVISFSLLNCGI